MSAASLRHIAEQIHAWARLSPTWVLDLDPDEACAHGEVLTQATEDLYKIRDAMFWAGYEPTEAEIEAEEACRACREHRRVLARREAALTTTTA